MTQTEIINALSALAEVVKVNIGTAEHKMIKLANDKIAELIPLLNDNTKKVTLANGREVVVNGEQFICPACGGNEGVHNVEGLEIREGYISGNCVAVKSCAICGLKVPQERFWVAGKMRESVK
jgi:arginine deiminase